MQRGEMNAGWGEERRGELEMGPGSRTEWGGWRSRFRMPHSTHLSPLLRHSAFLFCILHRGVNFRIPHSSRPSAFPHHTLQHWFVRRAPARPQRIFYVSARTPARSPARLSACLFMLLTETVRV